MTWRAFVPVPTHDVIDALTPPAASCRVQALVPNLAVRRQVERLLHEERHACKQASEQDEGAFADGAARGGRFGQKGIGEGRAQGTVRGVGGGRGA